MVLKKPYGSVPPTWWHYGKAIPPIMHAHVGGTACIVAFQAHDGLKMAVQIMDFFGKWHSFGGKWCWGLFLEKVVIWRPCSLKSRHSLDFLFRCRVFQDLFRKKVVNFMTFLCNKSFSWFVREQVVILRTCSLTSRHSHGFLVRCRHLQDLFRKKSLQFHDSRAKKSSIS